MVVDLRVKCDPRADGREAQLGDLIEFWVRWSCPDLAVQMVKVSTVVGGDEDQTRVVEELARWDDVVAYAAEFGVTLPSQPSCPGI